MPGHEMPGHEMPEMQGRMSWGDGGDRPAERWDKLQPSYYATA